jgi:hypothetical protein
MHFRRFQEKSRHIFSIGRHSGDQRCDIIARLSLWFLSLRFWRKRPLSLIAAEPEKRACMCVRAVQQQQQHLMRF